MGSIYAYFVIFESLEHGAIESLTLRRVNEKDVHKRASFFIYLEMRAFSYPRSVGSYLASLERLLPAAVKQRSATQSGARRYNKKRKRPDWDAFRRGQTPRISTKTPF